MRKAFLIVFAMLACVAVIISCSKSGGTTGGGGDNNNTLDCSAVAKTFSTDANPIFQTFCNQAGCHNNGSTNGPGPLTNYAQIFSARSDIRAAVAAGVMPQNTTLSLSQRNTILCWIDSGAPNN